MFSLKLIVEREKAIAICCEYLKLIVNQGMFLMKLIYMYQNNNT